MKVLLQGKIEGLVPSFRGTVNRNGVLSLQADGDLALTVDTGFNGGIALPEKILEKMKVELVDYGIFRLATGKEVELPVFWGRVAMGKSQVESWFIPGDSLIGMEFLSLAGPHLSFNFARREVKLCK